MRYFFACGERSGDLHASNLLKALYKEDPLAEVQGIGGELLQEAGATIKYHYKEMALMGFLEILQGIPRMLKYLSDTNQYIRQWKPDVVVLIDYGGFNMRLAKKLHGSGIKVFYYITPKVWAWNTGRVKSLARYVDQLYVILPFETSFFKKFGVTSHYVGNPVLDAVYGIEPIDGFLEQNRLSPSKTFVAILSGSRKQEVKQMMQVLPELCSRFPEFIFLVAAVSNLDHSAYDAVHTCSNASLIVDNTYQLLLHSKAAVVTSGTATLETALLGIPQVVVYRTSFVSYAIAKRLVKVKYISLVNLIAEKLVVPELIQDDYSTNRVGEYLGPLLSETESRNQQLHAIAELKNRMGKPGASEKTAQLMIEHLRKN